MNSSVPQSLNYSRSQRVGNCLRKNKFLESAAYDEYTVLQPAKTPPKSPSMLCAEPIRVIPIRTKVILWLAILILGTANKTEAQVPLKINLKTEAVDGTVKFGSKIKFQAEIENETKTPISGKLHWSLSDAEKKPIVNFAHAQVLEIPADSTATVAQALEAPAPGFYYATVTLDSGQEKYSQLFRFGCEPAAIKSGRVPEQDFEKFWSQTQQQLGEIEPHYRVTKQIESKNRKLKRFEVEFHSLGNVRVSGWLEIPNTPGPHPCVLRLPGYGQNMKPLNKFDDLAIFSFNIRGHGNSQKDISGKPNNFWIRGLEDKNIYFYRGAYMDCLRAMQFLKNHPQIDDQKIAVWGGSQGGGLALATAAFDPAVTYCVADIPFLVDWDNYFQLTRWPEMDQWIESKNDQDWSSVLKTMSYFDLMFLAPKIKCPVLSGIGLQDNVCPPTTIFCMLNRIKSPKKYVIYPERKHATGRQHPNLVWRTLRDHFQLND